jgi:predicted nucleic acid-binding protein
MPTVSDTSPILGLAIIGHLELLHEQFGAVFIPQAVLEELKIETGFRGVPSIQDAINEDWLQVRQVRNTRLVQALALELDKGEAEAIALAIELETEIIILDEHQGRAKARAMGLKTVGVLGILLRAKKAGRISSLRNVLDMLRHEAGFFIAENLYLQILQQAGE